MIQAQSVLPLVAWRRVGLCCAWRLWLYATAVPAGSPLPATLKLIADLIPVVGRAEHRPPGPDLRLALPPAPSAWVCGRRTSPRATLPAIMHIATSAMAPGIHACLAGSLALSPSAAANPHRTDPKAGLYTSTARTRLTYIGPSDGVRSVTCWCIGCEI